MITQDAAVHCVSQQVGCGLDALIAGGRAEVRAVLAGAAESLAATVNVVRVTAPAGGLNLSEMMAQLSGRADFDAQDDGVLELGFRRLAMSTDGRPTVLLLDGTAGLTRPVLRYLQHVGRNAAGLTFVVAGGPGLAAQMDEASFTPLRTRLAARPAMALGGVAESEVAEGAAAMVEQAPVIAPVVVAEPTPFVPTVVGMRLARLSEPNQAGAGSRRRLPWAIAGLGVAASVALAAWFIGAPVVDIAASRASSAIASVPIEPARAPAPLLAKDSPVELAPQASSPRSVAAAPETAKFADAVPAIVPPVAAPAEPEADGSGFEAFEPPVAAQQPAQAAVVPAPRQVGVRARPQALPPLAPAAGERLARARVARHWDNAAAVERRRRWEEMEERAPEVARYEWGDARYAPAPEAPYVGTYVPGPFGTRVFRYEQN